MNVKNNQELFDLNTFKIKSVAKYFVVVKDIDELKQAVDFAKQNQLPVFVLGGGSNILLSDEGVNGLVIKMEIKGITFLSSLRDFPEPNFSTAQLVEPLKNLAQENHDSLVSSKTIQVIASAGEIWDDLVKQTIEKGLYGLENLSYIPGTVGASVVQNIGAYGVEVKDVIDWVEVFDIKTSKIKKVTGNFCDFGYRDSIFKKSEGKNLIVIRVAFNLQKNGKLKTDYKDIQEYFENKSFWITSSQAPRKDDSKAIVDDEKLCFSSSLRKKKNFLSFLRAKRNFLLFLREVERSETTKQSSVFCPFVRLCERSEAIQRFLFFCSSLRAKRSNSENPKTTLKELRNAIIKIRKNKLPDWKKIGTVGSFFKNPIVTEEQLNKLLEKYPELPHYKSGVSDIPQFKIPLAYILDKILELKGIKEGNVGLYENQPLVLVNFGNATFEEIKNFAQKIQKKVKQETGLDIDFEVVEW